MNSKNKGFTLIEVLVVMVILSLTTSLLISGLTTTWSNFERLNTRQLKINALELPQLWFKEAYENALHSHPHKSTLVGESKVLTFTTFSTPNQVIKRPREVTWEREREGQQYRLVFSYTEPGEVNTTSITIKTFEQPFEFQYLHNGSWLNAFSMAGQLPVAVRIRLDSNETWVTSYLKREKDAHVPTELELFGAYEY